MPDENVIPFGKHKGEKLSDVMLTDPGWIDWASSQPWFRERFAALFAAIMNGGSRPDVPTPEHNRLQALFLDPLFAFAVYPYFTKNIWVGPGYGHHDYKDVPCTHKDLDIKFEVWGWDVLLTKKDEYHSPKAGIELKPSMGDEYPAVLRAIIHRPADTRIVLVDRFQAEMPLENVRSIFKASGVRLITLEEVEKVRYPYEGVEF